MITHPQVSPPLLAFREGLDDGGGEVDASAAAADADAASRSSAVAGSGGGSGSPVHELADLARGLANSGWGEEQGDWERKALPPALATVPWSQLEER